MTVDVIENTPWVLQFCHGYDGPFLDCARQYAVLFAGTGYKVCTIYLTGEANSEVVQGSASDEVLFLGYSSAEVRGLKLDAMRRIRYIIDGRNFRFCIAHRFKPIYIALLATRLPVVGVHHAFGVYKHKMRRWFISYFRSRLLLLSVSDAVRDEMRRHLSGWPIERIQTFYNRIDIAAVKAEQIDRKKARSALKLPESAWIVGNVGRLHSDKDQATLIHGFAQALPNLPANSLLVIMGEGRLEAELKRLVNELGIVERVHFLGQVKQGRRYFKAFDVFALTSDHEPFGMVLLEAMAADLPIIASDCGGGREVVEGIGQLFPLGDSQALAICLQKQSKAHYSSELANKKLQSIFSDEAAKIRFSHFKGILDDG